MYLDYFGLNEKPFSITPDPAFLYLSERHAEALAHLVYGVTESDGFIQLTGEVGTGKTTLTRRLLKELPEHVQVALIVNPRLDVNDFLLSLFQELGWPRPQTEGHKSLIDALNERLLVSHQQGQRTVLMIDEAQNLSSDVLEQLRLLTNLETHKQKLLQIILVGQPELRDVLARDDLRQLSQRVTARYHLGELSFFDTYKYINHRLSIAGADRPVVTRAAAKVIYKLSHGTPRLINTLTDRALLGAFSEQKAMVTSAIAKKAATQVLPQTKPSSNRFVHAFISVCVVAAIAAAAWWTVRPASAPMAQTPQAIIEVPASFTSSKPVIAERMPTRINTLPHWLLENNLTGSTDEAFSALFNAWQKPFDASLPACKQAQNVSLHCEYLTGSWPLIEKLNRPVILTLVDHQGDTYHVTLTSLDGPQAFISANDTDVAVPRLSLEPFWQGEALVLWRPYPGSETMLMQNHASPAVDWLRQQLETLQGGERHFAQRDVFDTTLTERVFNFQQTQGLVPDGRAGFKTLIALNTALNVPNTPVLTQVDD